MPTYFELSLPDGKLLLQLAQLVGRVHVHGLGTALADLHAVPETTHAH